MWFVTKEEYHQRYSICKSCPDLNDGMFKECKHCNCVMTFKCGLADAKCPIDKWKESSSKEQVSPDDVKVNNFVWDPSKDN